MKRMGILLMVMVVSVTLLFTGCGNKDDTQQDPQQMPQQQDVQQNAKGENSQTGTDPAGATMQGAQKEIATLQGEFQGLADGHSAEIVVDNESIVFQFYDEAIAEQLEIMEAGTRIQFDAETDMETGVKTITKLYEIAE